MFGWLWKKRNRLHLNHKALLKSVPISSSPLTSVLSKIPQDLPRLSLQTLLTPAPALLFLCGVNGAGKTTAIAKLLYHLTTKLGLDFSAIGILGTDTFRSAAMEQLQKRLAHFPCDLWTAPAQASIKPATALFQGLEKFLPQKQVILIDTSGRLHTDKNLMAELHALVSKGTQWAQTHSSVAHSEVVLVCDATHGQTLESQVQTFSQNLPLRGIIYTKIDCLADPTTFLTHLRAHPHPILGLGTGEHDEDFWFS